MNCWKKSPTGLKKIKNSLTEDKLENESCTFLDTGKNVMINNSYLPCVDEDLQIYLP